MINSPIPLILTLPRADLMKRLGTLLLLCAIGIAAPAIAEAPPIFLFDLPGEFDRVSQIARRADGRIYIADAYHHRIQVYTESGFYLESIGSFGTGLGQFNVASGIAFDHDDNIYVAEQFGNRITKLSPTALPLMTFGSTTHGQISVPTNLAFSPDGLTLYVTEFLGNKVSMFDTGGNFLGAWGSGGTGPGQFDHPYGIVTDALGEVFVADEFNNRVQHFTSNGTYIGEFGGFGTAPGKFRFVVGLGIDNAGDIYATDQLNNRIQKLTRDGAPLVQWGTFGAGPNQFYNPWAVLPTPSGRVFIGDTYNYRVSVYGTPPTPTNAVTWGSLKAKYR